MEQKPINHVAMVIDASPSMDGQQDTVIKVFDNQVKFLARRSKELNMETRITVYMFSSTWGGKPGFEALCYDMDVLRLPSLAGEYRLLEGRTALIDAAIRSQEELAQTAVLYGDHAFLTFVLTDGQENASRKTSADLKKLLQGQGDNWTMAVLVPDFNGKMWCTDMGFPASNVAIWDATSKQGVEEAGEQIQQATDNYLTQRSMGVTTKTGVFDMSTATVNHKTVKKLKEIVTGIEILPVHTAQDITRFITVEHGRTFRQGKYYFPLVKREKVGPQKNVVIRHKISKKVFGGPEVRELLGLPDHEVSIKPGINTEYDVFVQSTSTNRNLIPGHDLLVIE